MRRAGHPTLLHWLLGGTGIATLAALAIIASRPGLPVDANGCSVSGPHSRTLVLALDTTDQLAAAAPRQVHGALDDAIGKLSKGDRVVVVEVAGKVPAEVAPEIERCYPGNSNNTERKRLRENFLPPINSAMATLAKRHPATSSPLIEAIMAIAGDRRLSASALEIIFLTDALQNSPVGSLLKPHGKLPRITGRPLANVTVHLVLLRNQRDQAMQAAAADKLVQWLQNCGAKVVFHPPPWLSLLAAAKT